MCFPRLTLTKDNNKHNNPAQFIRSEQCDILVVIVIWYALCSLHNCNAFVSQAFLFIGLYFLATTIHGGCGYDNDTGKNDFFTQKKLNKESKV